MNHYTKAVLYTYPILKDLEDAYAEHIKSKAILSYKYFAPCEGLVEYLSEEICRKERLEWLEQLLNGIMDKLTDTERLLLQIRYFGKKRRGNIAGKNAIGKPWSESTYFRMQNRLEKRIESMLKKAGLTQQVFDEWFAPMQAFQYVSACLQRKADRLNNVEKDWFL